MQLACDVGVTPRGGSVPAAHTKASQSPPVAGYAAGGLSTLPDAHWQSACVTGLFPTVPAAHVNARQSPLDRGYAKGASERRSDPAEHAQLACDVGLGPTAVVPAAQ